MPEFELIGLIWKYKNNVLHQTILYVLSEVFVPVCLLFCLSAISNLIYLLVCNVLIGLLHLVFLLRSYDFKFFWVHFKHIFLTFACIFIMKYFSLWMLKLSYGFLTYQDYSMVVILVFIFDAFLWILSSLLYIKLIIL